MNKIALGVEYDGANYQGWQKQPALITVQSQLEQALSQVADQTINTYCAGRTDAGVHALAQVVHFETDALRSADNWLRGTNTNLTNDISVQWVKFVDSDFHARFSAIARSYQYVLYNHPVRPGLFGNYLSWYHNGELDVQRMQQAADYLRGEHDFSSFRAAGCQSKSTHRFIEYIQVKRINHYVIISIKANAFLYHMVRNIVGVLATIGNGKQAISWSKEVLQAKDRSQASITMPAAGLYFEQAYYPENYKIPMINNKLKLLL